jgi:hypothetical protein
MTTLTLDIDSATRPAPERPTARPGQRPTSLDDRVARTWSALLVSRAAACLLCGGDVVPRYGSGPHPVGGTCRSCGTEMA